MNINFKQNQVTNPFTFALELGYYAGLIWGPCFDILLAKIHEGARLLLEPFFKHEFLATTAGQIAGWLSFIAFSVIASLIYITLFRKLRGPWPGIAYGIVWWAVLFVALNPWLRLTDPVKKRLGIQTSLRFVFLYYGDYLSVIRLRRNSPMRNCANRRR